MLLREFDGEWPFFWGTERRNITQDPVCFDTVLFPGSRLVLTWRRLWRALWTSPPCVAAMETPMLTSAPCVLRGSEYTQLLLSHGTHTTAQYHPSWLYGGKSARVATWWWKNWQQSQDWTLADSSTSQFKWLCLFVFYGVTSLYWKMTVTPLVTLWKKSTRF